MKHSHTYLPFNISKDGGKVITSNKPKGEGFENRSERKSGSFKNKLKIWKYFTDILLVENYYINMYVNYIYIFFS